MINGFLSVAALESGKMQLVKEPFNLDNTIQEMVDDAITTHPRFTFNFLPCEPLPVLADKDKIGQVITNLLSNAVKYSPDGGEIRITCRKLENKAEVSIKDSGIGIHKEDLPNLFERFYRVQSDAMKSFSGFGIGLYLCAEIIGRHQGKIWAESEEGQGSTFYFNLLLAE
jgi:signal transduction histidine kinase